MLIFFLLITTTLDYFCYNINNFHLFEIYLHKEKRKNKTLIILSAILITLFTILIFDFLIYPYIYSNIEISSIILITITSLLYFKKFNDSKIQNYLFSVLGYVSYQLLIIITLELIIEIEIILFIASIIVLLLPVLLYFKIREIKSSKEVEMRELNKKFLNQKSNYERKKKLYNLFDEINEFQKIYPFNSIINLDTRILDSNLVEEIEKKREDILTNSTLRKYEKEVKFKIEVEIILDKYIEKTDKILSKYKSFDLELFNYIRSIYTEKPNYMDTNSNFISKIDLFNEKLNQLNNEYKDTFEEIKFRMPEVKENSLIDISRKILKGHIGEGKVNSKLNSLKYVYSGITLNSNKSNRKVEIDSLILTNKGIIVIEAKDYYADIIDIDSSGYICRNIKNKEEGLDVLSQVSRCNEILIEIFGNIKIVNIIVFTHDGVKINNRLNQEDLEIINLNLLSFKLKNIVQDDIENINKLKNTLESNLGEERKYNLFNLDENIEKIEKLLNKKKTL